MSTEKEKHIQYLNKGNFNLDVPQKWLRVVEIEYLVKYGYWLQALYEGKIKPLTTTQTKFLNVCVEKKWPENNIQEYSWNKYLKLRNDWGEIYDILNQTSDKELNPIYEILKLDKKNKLEIVYAISENSKNLLNYFDEDQYISYKEILIKVAKKLKIENEFYTANISKIEIDIVQTLYNKQINKLNIKDKEKLELALKKEFSNTNLETSGKALTALTAANLSGFSLYIMSSTILSFTSGILGITLPFAAYTGLSSTISFIIGPYGWAALGIYTAWNLTNANYNKIIPIIIYINNLKLRKELNLIESK